MSNLMDKAKGLLNKDSSNSGSTDTTSTTGSGTDASQAGQTGQTGGTSSFDTTLNNELTKEGIPQGADASIDKAVDSEVSKFK